MRLAALFSGGKDSTYAIYLAKKQGNSINYLATIFSKRNDSYMYHTLNIGLTLFQAKAMGIKLISKESSGKKEKEVKDLEILLSGLDIDGVVCGAIASRYQRERVRKVCKKLGLKLLNPLWGIDVDSYIKNLIQNKFNIMITGVFAEGFSKSWIGRKLDENCIIDLKDLERKYKINIAGEGGEFETAVLDCPLFKKKIRILNSEIHWDKNTKTGFLEIKDVKLVQKKNIINNTNKINA